MALAYACAVGDPRGSDATPPLTIDIGKEVVLLYPNPLRLEGRVTLEGVAIDASDLQWELVSGPAEIEVTETDSALEVHLPEPGEYRLLVTADWAGGTASRELLVNVVVPQASYYVSPDGDNDNDGRSVMSPLRTIERAARLVRPGDVVMLRGGVYNEYNTASSWRRSGEPGAPITFTSYPGETAIIDGSHEERSPRSRNPSAPELIRIVDLDWYVFENLVFRNSAGRGISLEGNNHVIRHVTSHSNHGDGIFLIGDDNLVEDSLSYDNYSTLNDGESADGLKIDRGARNVIRRVVAFDNSDDGFDLWASTDTLIEQSAAYRNGRGSRGNGTGFKLSSAGVDSNTVVRYNIAYSNRSHNFSDNGGGSLQIYNNTSFDSGAFGFVVRGRAGIKASTVYNNISFRDENGVLLDIQTRGGEMPIADDNSWDLRIRNPEFLSTDPDSPSFLRLSPDSPAVDAGRDNGMPYHGDGVDLGAYETRP